MIEERDAYKRTPLMLAVMNGFYTGQVLLLKKDAYANARDIFGRTALFYSAMRGDIISGLLLIRYDADIERIDDFGLHPFVYALMNGHRSFCEMLILEGLDPNFRLKDGMTLLMYGAIYADPYVIEMLLSNGADRYALNDVGLRAIDYVPAARSGIRSLLL